MTDKMILQKQCSPMTCRGRLLGEIYNLRGEYLKYNTIINCGLYMSGITYNELKQEIDKLPHFTGYCQKDPRDTGCGIVYGLPIRIDNLIEPYRFIIKEEDIMKIDSDSITINIGGMSYGKTYFTNNINKLPKKYILNQDASILFWEDDTKTIVKLSEEDNNDPVKGFLWAYFLKHSGLSRTKANKYLKEIADAVKEAISDR